MSPFISIVEILEEEKRESSLWKLYNFYKNNEKNILRGLLIGKFIFIGYNILKINKDINQIKTDIKQLKDNNN